jgi:polyisoprenoid-binding protein YceI
MRVHLPASSFSGSVSRIGAACRRRTPATLARLVALALAFLPACENPAADKPRAAVSAAATLEKAPAGGATEAKAGPAYKITAGNSKIEWTGSKVTGSHDGSFASFSGAVRLGEGGAIETGSISLDIDATSLTVSPDKLLNHLKSAEFFDVAKFPTVTFRSTSVKPIAQAGSAGATHTITGNLELHGVTKSISFPAAVSAAPDAIDAKAVFSINRKDFGLNYPGKADDLIRGDVLVKLTVHATKG